jgi:hypothetical protein
VKRRRLSILGRLVLIVSLWHAPLPVLHAHDADIHDASSSAEFVDHLAEYHPEVALNSHFDFGWHWHLVPPPVTHPGGESQDGTCPFCPQDGPTTLPQAQTSVVSLQTACTWIVSEWMPGLAVGTGLVRRVSSVTSTQFLDTYLGSVPLGTLLRVARC